MVKKKEQAANEYAEQAQRMEELIEELQGYAVALFDVRGPEEVSWGDVELLKSINNQLGYTLTLMQTDDNA